MRFRLSENYFIDSQDYEQEGLRIAVLAQSGHGKSYLAAKIVEGALTQNFQVLVVEPIAEWHSLKAKFNSVAVVGGEFQDLPLEADFAGEYVRMSLTQNLSMVFCVGELPTEYEQRQFVSDLLWSLYRLEQKQRKPVFLVLEEADFFGPQMWDRESKLSLARCSMIAKHGRKLGIFPILITQRPADLHKSILSQANIFFLGRFTGKADLEAVTWLAKKLRISFNEKALAELKVGEWLVWDKHGLTKIQVEKRICPHGADTPLIQPVPFTVETSQTLTELKTKIEKILAEKRKEKSELEKLKHENLQLQQQIHELKRKLEVKETIKDLFTFEGKPVTVEVSKFETRIKELEEELLKIKEERDKAVNTLSQIRSLLNGYPATPQQPVPAYQVNAKKAIVDKLPNYEKTIYLFLDKHKGITFTQYEIAVGTGLSHKSSRFQQALRRLKQLNLIQQIQGKITAVANHG